MFFGSALSNFGLEPFLKALTELAPPPRAAHERPGPDRARVAALQRVRVQDPGEHEPPPSRPRGVPAGLLGRVREGHGDHQRAAGRGDPRVAAVSLLRRQSRDHRARLSGRRRRPRQPRPVRHRRHAVLTASRSSTRPSRASRRNTSASPVCATCASSSSTMASASSRKRA